MGPTPRFHNLLLGTVTPGPSTAPENVNTFYIFLLKPHIYLSLKILLLGSAASWPYLELMWFVLSCQMACARFAFPPGPESLARLPSQTPTIHIVRQRVTLPWENCKSEECLWTLQWSAEVEVGVPATRLGAGGARLPGAPCVASRWRSIREACKDPVQKLERVVDGTAREEYSRVSPRRGGHPRKSEERKSGASCWSYSSFQTQRAPLRKGFGRGEYGKGSALLFLGYCP